MRIAREARCIVHGRAPPRQRRDNMTRKRIVKAPLRVGRQRGMTFGPARAGGGPLVRRHRAVMTKMEPLEDLRRWGIVSGHRLVKHIFLLFVKDR